MQINKRFELIGTPRGIIMDGEPIAQSPSLDKLTARGLYHIISACQIIATMTPEDWHVPIITGPTGLPTLNKNNPERAVSEIELAMANRSTFPWMPQSEISMADEEPTLEELTKNNPQWMDELRDALGRFADSLAPGVYAAGQPAPKIPASARKPNNQGKNKAAHEPAYPNHWDAKVDKYVAEHNAKYGYKLGDAEYLDPNLVKAMIKVESGYDLNAYNTDPMQVNKYTRDWDDKKAKYGLKEGVKPGADLSIRAGIGWLYYKAYEYDGHGHKRFKGWRDAVQSYNSRNPKKGDPHYAEKVFQEYLTCSQ